MESIGSVRNWLRTGLVVAAVVVGMSGGGARAQWGWGLGWGWGGMWGGGQIYNRQTLQYLNQRSLAAANAALAARSNGPTQNGMYVNNPNAYFNHAMTGTGSTNFFPRYDVSSRRTIDSQALAMRDVPARPVQEPKPTQEPKPAAGSETAALLGFFNAMGQLVWPGDAPTAGELGTKRTAADQSAGDVYREVKDRGYASIGLVTDARSKLVDYGRPALEYLHAQASPAVADTFHRFLLSFYNALGHSAYPGTASSGR